jgi:DNA-binding LytR/AlgR family response regulator
MKTLLVDDEPLALSRLAHLAKDIDSIEIVGTCRDGATAIQTAKKVLPELVLLDIKMPGPDGFEVAQEMQNLNPPPEIVFVTAFDHYAVKAFEVHALDYLLKPVEKNRLAETVQLAAKRLFARETSQKTKEFNVIIKDLREALGEKQREENKRAIWIREKGRMLRINSADIEWIKAERDYVRIHIGERTHLMRNTMSAISKSLNPAQFVRVHRSAIVNTAVVRQLRLGPTGAHVLRLKNGVEVPVGRSYRKSVATRLQTKE